MDCKLRRWEITMMAVIFVIMLAGGWLGGEQRELSDSVIRLHVIANSDSAEDQALKLAVRDRVLACAEQFYPENADIELAGRVLAEHLSQLSQEGERTAAEWGRAYPVTAQLRQCWFPTREYDGFRLPAGNYYALRVVIGEGKGHNWWCVAFPPLCMGAASESLEDAVQAGHFSVEQARLLREENGGYVLKFKSLELLGKFQRFFLHK